jgi:hypothetical protein
LRGVRMLGFELRATRCPHSSAQSVCVSYFSGSILLFWPASLEQAPPKYTNWVARITGAPLYLAYSLRWGLTNVLPMLVTNPDLSSCCLLSSWDYRCEPLNPAPVCLS